MAYRDEYGIGPVLREVCTECRYQLPVQDWKEGNYYKCTHPEAWTFAPKKFPYSTMSNSLTPDWCPAKALGQVVDRTKPSRG